MKVPNSAAASAKASEKQVVRTCAAGTVSTSAPSMVPLVDAEIGREHHLDRERLAEGRRRPHASAAPDRR